MNTKRGKPVVKIYIEGGGDQRKLKNECRHAFSEFFRQADLTPHKPKLVACGSRNNAYDDFCIATRNAASNNTIPFLLVDSEAPVEAKHSAYPWNHLEACDAWSKPDGVGQNQAHLMTQCMESWFLADKTALAEFFGQDFNEKSLPIRPDIENVPKEDVLAALKKATSKTQKGPYGKGVHSFKILETVNPSKVTEASPWAKRLVKELKDAMST